MSAGAPRRAALKASVERLAPAVSRWLLISVIVVSVLALGSLPPDALLVMTALATLTAASCLLGRGFSRDAFPTPTWLILGLTLYTAIQTLPLPASVVSTIAPANRDVWERAFEALGEQPPAWLPLSLDPGATWLEVSKGWLYACVFLSATYVGARRGAGFGATVILVSALALGLVCLGHGLLDATRVYGIYTPTMRGSGFGVAPLLNPNNRAGYLNLGILCGVSMLAMRRPPGSRWLAPLAIPPIVAVSLLTGSRGGLLGLLAGLGLLGLLLQPKLRQQHRDSVHTKQLLVTGAAVLAVGAVFAVGAAGPKLRHLLVDQNNSKLSVMAVALRLLPVHFWTGIGRGSFESVFPALRTATDNTISSHPENFPIQWATEWGVPVALLSLGLAAFLFRPRNWGVARSIPACGLLCGVVALLVQNLFDLGSEVPGIMVAAVAAAGFAWGARVGKLNRSERRGSYLTFVALGVGALVLWAGFRHGRDTLASDRDWLRDRHSGGEGWASFRNELRQAILRHPAEPYFPRLAAMAAWKSGIENPIPWINHALSRGMSAGRTHYLLGGYLTSLGKRAQALMELRMAATYDPSLSGNVAKLAVRLSQSEDELLRCVPDGSAGARLLTTLAKDLATSQPQLATSFLRQAVARDPTGVGPRLALVRRLLDDVDSPTPSSCSDESACVTEASQLLANSNENNAEVIRLRARMLMASGKAADAVQLLAAECRRVDHPVPCIASWVEAAKRAHDGKGLRQATHALESENCVVASQCDAIFWAAGQAGVALGDSEFALRYLERAAAGQRSVARWREVARIARESGQPARAEGALVRARLIDPGNPVLRQEFDTARHAAIEQMVGK